MKKQRIYIGKLVMVNILHSCVSLGIMYEKGLGVDGQDYEESANLYQQACGDKNLEGCTLLKNLKKSGILE